VLYSYSLDYTTKALILFDLSSIPASASVKSASLDVTIESWINPQQLIGQFVTTPWNYDAPGFGWTDSGTMAWKTLGIGSADVAGPIFGFTNIDASGYQRRSAALDAASVQSWIHDSAANRGVVLTNPNANKVLRILSSEASNPAQRPTLTVTYE
jgi:hypothetical protein